MIAAPRPVDLDIPASHADLFVRRVCGVLTTLRADGQPRSSLVWIDLDDGSAVINTALGRQKARNLQADRRCSLLVVDPDDTSRFIQIRGEAELSTDGALDHRVQHWHCDGHVPDIRATEGLVEDEIGVLAAHRPTFPVSFATASAISDQSATLIAKEVVVSTQASRRTRSSIVPSTV